MVDDIVLTEEEQAEQTKQWLKKNVPSIVVGLLIGVAAVYGYTYHSDSKIKEAAAASALFEKVISSGEVTKRAAEEVAVFKDDYSATPYAAKIVLLHAKGLAEEGKLNDALSELQWAEKNAKEDLVSSLAKLRQAEVLIAEKRFDEALKIVSKTAPAGFESNYLELQGDIAAANQDYKTAKQYYTDALNNGAVELGYTTYLQIKINKMSSLAKSNG